MSLNPNYVHAITIYRKQEDGTYMRSVLHNCFWHVNTTTTQNGTEASLSNVYVVRIPMAEAGEGFIVSLGDIVIHGEHTDEISNEKGSRAAEILLKHKPEAFKVTAFSDNTSHMMDKHYRLGG